MTYGPKAVRDAARPQRTGRPSSGGHRTVTERLAAREQGPPRREGPAVVVSWAESRYRLWVQLVKPMFLPSPMSADVGKLVP